MYRQRCRPAYSDEELTEVYAAPWVMDPTWKDHKLRLNKTLELAGRFIDERDTSGADLSCGDSYFATHIPQIDWTLGDFAPGYDITGPIETTIRTIGYVDVFVCCETLEHLDDPDALLRAIRYKSKKLIVSSPICQWIDVNPQHYWSFDKGAYRKMLRDAGWEIVEFEETYADPGYCFQIYGCI